MRVLHQLAKYTNKCIIIMKVHEYVYNMNKEKYTKKFIFVQYANCKSTRINVQCGYKVKEMRPQQPSKPKALETLSHIPVSEPPRAIPIDRKMLKGLLNNQYEYGGKIYVQIYDRL